MPFDVPVQLLGGPDITDWQETAVITRVEFQPGNFLVRHSKEGKRADSWPAQHVPGWGNGRDDPGDIQWTLYVVINADGQWRTTPCILYWPEATPSLGVHRGGSGAPFSDAARNWYYQAGGMAGRQPGPGQRIGLIAVAGALRGVDVRQIAERSPICWVTVPPGDSGAFDFAAPVPAPAPPPPEPPVAPPVAPVPPVLPQVPPVPATLSLGQMAAITAGVALLVRGLTMIVKALAR